MGFASSFLSWFRRPTVPAPAATAAGAPVIGGAASLADQIKELAKDLVTIEVNTIVKDNMTAGRMPPVPLALLNIAHAYVGAFERLNIRAEWNEGAAPQPPTLPPGTMDFGDTLPAPTLRTLGEDEPAFDFPEHEISFAKLFRRLQLAADQVLRDKNYVFAQKECVLLKRISDNSETLWYFLKKYRGLGGNSVTIEAIKLDDARFDPPPELAARDMLIIRKIWEVGTEVVVAQTVVQLDGDIITRIAPDYRAFVEGDDKGEQLLNLHDKGLHTAISRWDSLVGAAVAVVRGIGKDLT